MRIATAKQTYQADEALFDTRVQRLWLLFLAAALALFPFVADAYWLYLACLVAINVASATGLNILTGYTGLVSLGQAAFMGLGAYTVAVLEQRLGTPALLNLLAAGVVAMLGGLVVGVPSLRVKGCTWRSPRSPRPSSRTSSSPTGRSPAAPPAAGAARAVVRGRPGYLVPDLLADRAADRADGAGRGQSVPHAHRPRLHRHPRPRHLGRGAGHPAAALQAAVLRPVSFYAGVAGGLWPTSSAWSRRRAFR